MTEFPDTDALLREIGVRFGRDLELDTQAPRAEAREAIVAPR
ncbi:MAG: hypothetical protein R3B99_27145 [Polyangiales bacterium]